MNSEKMPKSLRKEDYDKQVIRRWHRSLGKRSTRQIIREELNGMNEQTQYNLLDEASVLNAKLEAVNSLLDDPCPKSIYEDDAEDTQIELNEKRKVSDLANHIDRFKVQTFEYRALLGSYRLEKCSEQPVNLKKLRSELIAAQEKLNVCA